MKKAITVVPGFDPVPSITRHAALVVSVAETAAAGDATAVLLGPAHEAPAALGVDTAALRAAGFTGAVGQALVLPGTAGPAVAVGIGDPADVTTGVLHDVAAAFARATASAARVAVVLDGAVGPVPAGDAATALVEGIVLSRYRWGALKREVPGTDLDSITVVSTDPGVTAGAQRGRSLAAAGSVARDLANTPPAHLTATRIADLCVERAADWGLEVEVFDEGALAELGCGGLLGVNGGSAEPPRMVKATYRPEGAGPDTPHLTLVGKGIMYDSGGISLKPGDAVHATMKNDMSGAAAVVGALSALRAVGCPTAVTAYLMCTDNMPSGTAMALGDVLTVRGGTTVEVINTDAEGRLVMADALVLATEDRTDAIIDIATLTGACMRALGTRVGGVMGNHQGLIDQLRASADRTDEPLWQLPLEHRYRYELDSDVADIKNLGGPNGGAIHAALFLAEFVGDVPWAHVDIAGTAQADGRVAWHPQGCTGFGARLLVDLAEGFTSP
jgi:leucyl aminopeptidase